MTTWTTGDVSGSQTLTDNDHLYPSHINELRTAINNGVMVVVDVSGAVGGYTDIQSALNALPATGGLVYIKSGTYTLSSAITVTKSNTKIIGEGLSTIITVNAAWANDSGFDINSGGASTISGIEIANLQMDFGGKGNPLVSSACIIANNITFSSFHDLWLNDTGYTPLWLSNSQHCWVYNNVMDTHLQGFRLFTDGIKPITSHIYFFHNEVKNISTYSGVVDNDSNYCQFVNNYFYNIGENGIEISDSGTFSNTENNLISGNVLELGGQYVEGSGLGMGNYTIITNNIIKDWAGYGIFLNGGGSPKNTYIHVTGNEIINTTGTNGLGIYAINSNYNSIVGNKIIGSSKSGILLNVADYNLVNGNFFMNNGSAANDTHYDVSLANASAHNQISNNRSIALGTNKVRYFAVDTNLNYFHGNMWVGAVNGSVESLGAGSFEDDTRNI